MLSSAAARTARTGLTGPPGWGAAGKNLLCSQQSMQHNCISAHAAPILRLCVHARKKKKQVTHLAVMVELDKAAVSIPLKHMQKG